MSPSFPWVLEGLQYVHKRWTTPAAGNTPGPRPSPSTPIRGTTEAELPFFHLDSSTGADQYLHMIGRTGGATGAPPALLARVRMRKVRPALKRLTQGACGGRTPAAVLPTRIRQGKQR
ncbi:hypothetical protein NDU88_004075 [Pleurodeles waltl]|uniref:Uncharacterized protein n=1 Tax=Pleurodeles waltl TaxID=8319 RepID=A0AAV7M596_PLEWA|nr:hypothetical protein NDU88_004075 [Pleurodeles waltl]